MLLTALSESIQNLEVYHGGAKSGGRFVTYYTTSEEMARSYAEMHNDRFGSGDVHKEIITIRNPAPESVIENQARRVGIDNSNYTPASVFDHNLHGDREVLTLTKALKRLGYDGAILGDIGYGVRVEGKVYIVFN
jgi:hypothetical protein